MTKTKTNILFVFLFCLYALINGKDLFLPDILVLLYFACPGMIFFCNGLSSPFLFVGRGVMPVQCTKGAET